MFNITPLPGYAIFKQYIMNGGSGDPGSEKALLFLEKVRRIPIMKICSQIILYT